MIVLQDEYGLSLVAYASGVGSARLNQLLALLLDTRLVSSPGLVACIPPHHGTYDSQAASTNALAGAVGVVTSLIDLPSVPGLPSWNHARSHAAVATLQGRLPASSKSRFARKVASGKETSPVSAGLVPCQAAMGKLAQQRTMSCFSASWDWHATAGLPAASAVWNSLELAILADFPTRVQVCCAP